MAKRPIAESPQVCTSDTTSTCVGMQYALDYQGGRALGMHVGTSMDMATGKCCSTFVYRTAKGNKLLMLNFCPWCGEKLTVKEKPNG